MKRSHSLEKSLDDVKYEQYVNNLHDRLPQLTDPSEIDCKRWPWELLQNAKDTVVKREKPEERYVDVTIRYYTDSDGKKKLYFEHNGDQFTNKAITGLIWKFSAEKRNKQTTEDGLTRDKQSTGRFGTGFMTTHALSFTVDVSGSLFHDDPGIMRNVSIDFTLHREGPDDEAYKIGVDKTENEIDENMGKRPIPVGQTLPTRFTYHIDKEAGEKAAMMGIANIRTNAAQAMLFCPSVRSITVIDDENNVTFKITRKNNDESKNVVKETVFVECSSDKKESVIRRFISMEIEEYSKEISSHWKAKDRNLRLHVAVEVDENNNILPIPSTSPAIYCSLPLIGFESMSLPFYINSNDFEPTTERTSLYLKKKRYEYRTNENTEEEEQFYLQSGINWAILERSLSLYETIVDYLIENGYSNRYYLINGLSDILNGSWGNETKNCLASRFIVPLRNMLVRKDLVKTVDGYRSIESDVKFVECSKDNNLHNLYAICKTIYGTDLAIEEENAKWVALKWGRFAFDSEFEEKKPDSENPAFPTIKYDKVAKYIEDAKNIDNLCIIIDDNSNIEHESNEELRKSCLRERKLNWLNNFYEWIETSNITNLSNNNIVPNRLGEFCSTEQGCKLKDASDIPTSIFDFMKKLDIDWDKNLLMEGVQHITLVKETKDNIVTAIKNRTKEIRDYPYDNEGTKLLKLMPILLALPTNKDGRLEDFYKKRLQIISIINTMYRDKICNVKTISLELKSETWDETDKWLMNVVAKDIANRKKLDIILEDDTEEIIRDKYCTAIWLSETLNFMFQKSYLHQEDITSKEGKTNTLALIPNRYGDFCPINKLCKQGQIPNKLLHDELSKTGYDVKQELLYEKFSLNENISISEMTVSALAKEYNKFFEGDDDCDKELVANYLIHLVPECGDSFQEIRNLYDEYNLIDAPNISIIKTSDLNVWKGAKEYIIGLLVEKASSCKDVYTIGKTLKKNAKNQNLPYEQRKICVEAGMSWLNRLANIIEINKYTISEGIKLVPDWNGELQSNEAMAYDGAVLSKYKSIQSLIDIVEGDLWTHYDNNLKEDGDDNIIESIVNSEYIFTNKYQNNTDERLFGIVDKLISYCSDNNDTSWRPILKGAIDSLLRFFEENSSIIIWGNNPKWIQNFHKTYPLRKDLYYDYICDAETKARISRINDNFSAEEIDRLINEKETVKGILANKDYYAGLEEKNKTLQGMVESLQDIHTLLKDCSSEKLDDIKEIIQKLVVEHSTGSNDEIPLGGQDSTELVLVPQTHEIEVENSEGHIQKVKVDQVQYAGLSLEEIERYVEEAKGAVVKYFRELNDANPNLGLQFDKERIGRHSYSQLYGIFNKYGKELPIVVHSYKGPQYRYFDLNWYDWQLLSKEGSMLFVLTVTGLQCIPLYALPVRNFNISIEDEMSNDTKAALLTLAAVGKQYSRLSFYFGNNMPQGFKDPIPFDYVPEELDKCITSIKNVCDQNIPQITNVYNYGKNMSLVNSTVGYSIAMKDIEDGNARDIFEAPIEGTPKAPSVGTSFID